MQVFKIYYFSSEIIFGQLLGHFVLVTLSTTTIITTIIIIAAQKSSLIGGSLPRFSFHR